MTNKDRIEGKVTETKGKLTGDDSEELKGKTQNKYGKAKDKVEDFADDVSRKVNDFFD
ncbi:MAG: CsbD family protein, partial [Enterococcus casseliflavus]